MTVASRFSNTFRSFCTLASTNIPQSNDCKVTDAATGSFTVTEPSRMASAMALSTYFRPGVHQMLALGADFFIEGGKFASHAGIGATADMAVLLGLFLLDLINDTGKNCGCAPKAELAARRCGPSPDASPSNAPRKPAATRSALEGKK